VNSNSSKSGSTCSSSKMGKEEGGEIGRCFSIYSEYLDQQDFSKRISSSYRLLISIRQHTSANVSSSYRRGIPYY
jgi:hypothetical protein